MAIDLLSDEKENKNEPIDLLADNQKSYLPSIQQNKSQELQQTNDRTGIGGIGKDVLESVLTSPYAALESALNLPGHIESGVEYTKKEPSYKSAGQLGIGGLEGIAGLLSSPQVGARYLSEKFANPEGKINKSLHETPTPYELMQDYEKQFNLGATKKGESELRALGQLLLARKGASIPSKAARVGTLSASVAGQGGDPIHAALGAWIADNAIKKVKKAPGWIEDYRDKGDLENKIAASESDLENSESSLKTAQAKAGSSSTEKLKVKSDNLEKQLNELDEKLKDISPENDATISNPNRMIPNLTHETNLQNAQGILEQSNQGLEQAHESQSQQLGRGQNFSERASPLITQGVEDIKNSIRPLYDSVDNDLRQRNVIIPNNERTVEINNAMNQLINNGTISPENDAVYDNILRQLQEQWGDNESESIPATDYVQIYKSTRDLARIARSRSRQGGIQADERRRWEQQATHLEPLVEQQRNLLRDSIPTETFNNLTEADRQWGQHVIPFYNNSVYRNVMREGHTPNNIIEATKGTSDSNRIMQRLIQSIPELNRVSLGQIYSERPQKLLNYNEMTQPYVEAHEPTRRGIESQNRAIESQQRATDVYQRANERAETERDRQNSTANELKDTEKQKQKLTSDIDKLSKELDENNKNIKNLEMEIKKHGENKTRNDKLKELKKQKEKSKSKLWSIATSGIGYLAGGQVKNIFTLLFK